MKVLVTGDRNWIDEEVMEQAFSDLVFEYFVKDNDNYDKAEKITVIEGGARGADIMAAHFGKVFGWEVIEVPADWERYGKAAGPIRNQEMLDMDPDIVLAFHGNIDKSKGTKDMIKRAEKKGVKVILYSGK